MSVIDPMTEGPTQGEILAARQDYQRRLLSDICETLGEESIVVSQILDGKTTWQWYKLNQIITFEWQQFMCLVESIQESVLIKVENIFVVWYQLYQTNRYWEWLDAGTIIRDISHTWDAPSWSSNQVWSFNSRWGLNIDMNASPLDITVDHHWMMSTKKRSVPDYTISPIHMIAQNQRFRQQWKIMD